MTDMNCDRVILVNSSNRVFGDIIPLGLIAVATELTRHGLDCSIIDLPSEDSAWIEHQITHFWSTQNLERLLFIGFSSMCNTLPRSLSLAANLKKNHPGIPVVFGGPEASLNAWKLINSYPFIDVVIVGEAETVLFDLLVSLRTGQQHNKPGLWFGESVSQGTTVGGEIVAPEMAPTVDLENVEPLDYGTYRHAMDRRQAAIEVGRGCPYNCSYCSTQEFFGRKFRLKKTDQILLEVERLVRTRGVEHLDFVHDMFTCDRKRVVEICQALKQSSLHVKWSCSARPDSVDMELLRLLNQAGCVDIFFGLETGSPRLQKLINKRLNVEDSLSVIRSALDCGMNVIVALIIGFPQESENDLVATLTTALRIWSWRPQRVNIQVHLLSPLTGTRLTDEYTGQILYDGHNPTLTSVNCLTAWEEAQVRTRPDIFSSFYYFRNQKISRSTYKWLHAAFTIGGEDDFFHQLYRRYNEKAGNVLLDWARRKGQFPIDPVYYNRWSTFRRQRDY